MNIFTKFITSSLLIALLSVAAATPGNAQYVKQVWQNVELGESIGSSNIWCTDLEGDGKEEIIAGGGGYPNRHFSILQYAEKDFVAKWTSKWHDTNYIRRIEVANLDNDADSEIYVVLNNGQIEVYDGATMASIDTIMTQARNANAANIGDVDGDGEAEITLIGDSYLQVYDLDTGLQEWSTTAYNGSDVEVGDVDQDGQNEIVLSNGYILDGVTHLVEWSYVGGFGFDIELANIDQDAATEIIGMSNWYFITAFDGQLHTPLWQINTNDDHDALYVTDLDGDGIAEIFMGNGQWGAINCYSAATQQKLWAINNPEHGVTNISLGDPDGDGVKEVIWGAGQSSSGPDYLFIGNTKTRQIEWQSLDLDGPFAVSVFDVDHDSTNDIIGASRRSNSGYNAGVVLIYNGVRHNLEWFSNETGYSEIRGLAAGNINDTPQGEIVVSAADKIYVLDGVTHRKIWESPGIDPVNVVALADIDRDRIVEIVAGDDRGYITVYNGQTFAQEWKSINTGTRIGGMTLSNCDQDEALEIVFFGKNGIIQIYDGKTHLLEWQSTEATNVTALDINDLDQDGQAEIIAGRSGGQITIIDCKTRQIVESVAVANGSISGLAVANLDSIPGKEILIGTSTLKVLNASDYSVVWESAPFGNNVGDYGNLLVTDIDHDQYMDVLFGSSRGIFQLECSTPYPDITPPAVVSISPAHGLRLVGVDTEIKAIFSERIVNENLAQNVVVTSAQGDTIKAKVDYDENLSMVVCQPDTFLPGNNLINVTLKGGIVDPSGNGLDGNRNGVAEGSPADDFVWSFTTGAWVDTVGPVVLNARADVDSVWKGIKINVAATVSDSSNIAISGVAYVECFIDSIGEYGKGIPVAPVDGELDAVVEKVTLTLRTDGWKGGKHKILLHGKDTNDNWGKFVEVTVHILSEMAANWPMFGQNAQHTGFNQDDSIKVPLELKWSRKISPSALNPITVANNTLFATSDVYFADAVLQAIDIENGAERWSYSFGRIFSINPPSFAYGYVYIQTCNHTPGTFLTAFDALSGKVVWQSPTSAQWESYQAPTISDGKVFINGGYYGGMYGFDAFTGDELWFRALAQEDGWTPAYYHGVVYSSGSGSSFNAIDAETGQVLYRVGSPGAGYTPAIHNDVLFTVNPVTAIDLNTQQVLWSKSGNYTPAIAYGMVFSVTGNALQVYDEKSGQTLWSFSGDGNLNHSPVLSRDYVFVSSNGNTYAINLKTHRSDWSYPVGGHLTLANNRLYIATPSGELYVFRERTTSVAEDNSSGLPKVYALSQNYPNPFNPATTIKYQLPKPGHVAIKIYNVNGQLVETLIDEMQPAGAHHIVWQAEGLSSGVYFYRIIAGDYEAVKRCVMVK